MNNKLFKISYCDEDKGALSKLSEDILKEEIEALPKIEKGKISFDTIYIYNLGDKIEAKILIRNAMDSPINFQLITLGIQDENNEILITQLIDLSEMAAIPPMHVRPYTIYFDMINLDSKLEINDKCKVIFVSKNINAFESSKSNIGYIDSPMRMEERILIHNYIKSMPPVIKNQISFKIYEKATDMEGNYYIILLVTNSFEKGAALDPFRIVFSNHLGISQAVKEVNEKIIIKSNATNAYKIFLEEKDIIDPKLSIDICNVSVESK